jgi:isopentenyl-diphosphate Delta-isomerase
MNKSQQVILVDDLNKQIGISSKIDAHLSGKLHRSFSIFIFNSKKELLIQKRAKNKYHSGGLWSNTVCSHPTPGETTINAANRRLIEEMGVYCEIKPVLSFTYFEKLDNNMIENECDTVFVGSYSGDMHANYHEVMDYRWVNKKQLQEDVLVNPCEYTYWFKDPL